MMKLNSEDKKKISETIKNVEIKTSGEIVSAIVSKSDLYRESQFATSICFTLLVLAILLFKFEYESHETFLLIFLTTIIGFFAGSLNIFKRLFLNKSVMAEEVHQKAVQLFFSNNLHHTEQRIGVLIMISLLEKRVEILGDKGINEKVDQNFWDQITQKMVKSIKSGNVTQAMNEAILECGVVLEKEFPASGKNPNELPDRLITDL
ncbi:MAG: TPM domain-containing protein [Bacteriovoracaceae bacterium]